MLMDTYADTLIFTEQRNNEIIGTTTRDVSEMTTTDLIDTFVQIMRIKGYHDVSIWRALKEKSEDMEEYFESICESKEEWGEDHPDQMIMDFE